MYFRKNILVLMMVMITLFSLTGCMGMMGYVLTPTPTPTIAPTATTTPTPTPTPKPTPTPEQDINAFRVGFSDETGYFSRFFDFGIQSPEDWYYYGRSDIDQANMIKAQRTDQEAYFQEYIDRLKDGEILYDYLAFADQSNELILIYVIDSSESTKRGNTEEKVLDFFAKSFFDKDDDGTDEATNIRSKTIWLNEIEHPLYFFEHNIGDAHTYSAILTIRQGTAFATILVNCPDQAMTEEVVYSIYSVHSKIK